MTEDVEPAMGGSRQVVEQQCHADVLAATQGRSQRQEGGGGGTVASVGIGAGQVETRDNATEYAGQDGEQGADQEESGKVTGGGE